MKGNLNMDAEFDNEGYWCTGDVFERRHNLLFFKSRKTDLIKVNSFNVSPVSIENALIIHPEVNEVCVTYRDRDLGEKEIVAIVSSENQINNTELFAFIKDKLINYEMPKEIIITTEPLPRNKMGKVQRHVVREKFVERT
jgi:acyl-coenzyme A synthetase/AMP-(fatty) acid ligase